MLSPLSRGGNLWAVPLRASLERSACRQEMLLRRTGYRVPRYRSARRQSEADGADGADCAPGADGAAGADGGDADRAAGRQARSAAISASTARSRGDLRGA
ncbi:hypothetical protein FX016_05435 [Cupriavidus gilardii]|nr:hypothetical protein FX016_05435 [Cupriavidus gilardii]